MKLVLATIMSQLELELLDPRPLTFDRRGFTFTPEGGVRDKSALQARGVLITVGEDEGNK